MRACAAPSLGAVVRSTAIDDIRGCLSQSDEWLCSPPCPCPARTVDELKELRELTGDENGAQRVAWTDTWAQAREWLRGKLDGLPLEDELDEAGNQWCTLHGRVGARAC